MINFIAKHLDPNGLKLKIHNIESVCCFMGKKIHKGIKIDDLISDVFTDFSYIINNSGYASIEAAMCITPIIPTQKGFNSLRNYSFLVTEKYLKLLKREDVFDIIFSINKIETPFILNVSYGFKKHTSYKSKINYSSDIFTITSDNAVIEFDSNVVIDFIDIVKKWYSIVEGKNNTSQQPTHFTKEEIMNGCTNTSKIVAYGIERYRLENAQLEKYRNTNLFTFIIHILNKQW